MRIEKVSYNSSNFTKKLQQNYVKIFFAESVFRKLVLFFKGKFVYLLDFPISNFGNMSGKINDRGNI